MHQIQTVVIPHQTPRRIDFAKQSCFVSSAIPISVTQSDDSTTLWVDSPSEPLPSELTNSVPSTLAATKRDS